MMRCISELPVVDDMVRWVLVGRLPCSCGRGASSVVARANHYSAKVLR